MDGPVVLAIDGNSLVHRSFHAQARTGAHTAGRPSWAVRGLLMQLVAAADRICPTTIVIGFDDPDESVRRARWPQYKANRVDKLDTLVEQLDDAVTAARRLGLQVIIPPGLEADDVLASTAAATRRAGAHTVVVTSDRDAFALIDDTTSVLRIIDGGVDASPMMTPDRLHLLLGVRPEQYRDFAALRGDPSDNLPGVRGIGPRTAARLLAEFGSAVAAFDSPDKVAEVLGNGVARRLAADGARDAWALNCQVMTMRDDLPVAVEVAGAIGTLEAAGASGASGGTGTLPLPAEQVAEVYRSHNLTWTLRDALRTLADVPAEVPVPARAQVWNDEPVRRAAPRRLPSLAPRRPETAQLALF